MLGAINKAMQKPGLIGIKSVSEAFSVSRLEQKGLLKLGSESELYALITLI